VTVPQDEQDRLVGAKELLRLEARARRRERPEPDREAADSALAVRLGGIPELAALVQDPSSGCVAAYVSYGTEPGTVAIRALLALSGVQVLLPVIRDDAGLGWAWDTGEVAAGSVSADIPEPTSDVVGHDAEGLLALGCRVVLVPALAVDHHGARLGKGGGFYDRVLGRLTKRADCPLLVAVVHADDVVDVVPVQPHDIAVDSVLTPAGYIALR
jgi:5-formyltetrahydrofolate cyclo-ligase